jgi:hypothetical protein
VPKGRFAQLTSWSYSVYVKWLECPFSVCLDKIMRVRITEPDNPNFVKGNRSHEIADTYISGVGKKRPALVDTIKMPGPDKVVIKVDMTAVEARLVDLRAKKARTEQEWAFTKAWDPTGWFDKDAWLRIKTDACADMTDPPTVDIVDWKTGRQYPEHKQQRSLYALGGLRLVQIGALAGGSKKVELTAAHIYTDTGITATEKFGMKNLEPLKREWLTRIREMMADTVYPTRTGRHCGWCKYAKSKGGPCPEKM